MILYENRRNAFSRNVILVTSSGVVLLILIAIISMAGVFAADNESQEVTDVRQETQIATTYKLSPYLRQSDIQVIVRDGTALLTGVVPEEINRELAEEIALGVEGIRTINNEIEVRADFETAQRDEAAERSFAEVIEDAGITTAVKSKLLWSRHTDGIATTVETRRGHVTLEGTANTQATKDLAGMLAQNTMGVVAVVNNLQLQADTGLQTDTDQRADGRTADNRSAELRNAADDAGDAISDAWITTKVKSTLLYSTNVSGTAINVHTDDGVVTLSGKVNNESGQELAIELARNVRGVKQVNAQDLTF
jgi:osmotically-inducible protein OsmY